MIMDSSNNPRLKKGGFGRVGSNGYLAYDDDGPGITAIVQLIGVSDMAYTDII